MLIKMSDESLLYGEFFTVAILLDHPPPPTMGPGRVGDRALLVHTRVAKWCIKPTEIIFQV